MSAPAEAPPPVNGNDVRAVRFRRSFGYDVAQVDELLGQVADELDAERAAGPLISAARFDTKASGYDIDAVEWFLGQVTRDTTGPGADQLGADPWRDLEVVNQFTCAASMPVQGEPQRKRAKKSADRRRWRQASDEAWAEFGGQAGTSLRCARVSPTTRALFTMAEQILASVHGVSRLSATVNGQTFVSAQARANPQPYSATVAQLAKQIVAEQNKHNARNARLAAKPGRAERDQAAAERSVRTLVDLSGNPVLYITGQNFNYRAGGRIWFSDQRWLWFPVRGTSGRNAIMTAVDQAGKSVVRYRRVGSAFSRRRSTVEICVHPGQGLTDELLLAIVLSTPWLTGYFQQPGGG